MMSGEEQVFYSADTVTQEARVDDETSDAYNFPAEFVRSLTASGLPPGELRLKTSCPLILLQNLSHSRELCNRTHLALTRISSRVLEVKIIGGNYHGKAEFIPRITPSPTEDDANFSFQLNVISSPCVWPSRSPTTKPRANPSNLLGLTFESLFFKFLIDSYMLHFPEQQTALTLRLSSPQTRSTPAQPIWSTLRFWLTR